MLGEYIENLLNTNEFELEQKQKEYNELLQQQQEIESWIENLKKENDLEQNIFSPRIAAAGGLGKLNQARVQLLENEKQQKETQKQLEELKKKQKEYRGMLAEADKERQNVEGGEKSQTLVNTGESDAEKVYEASIQKTEQIPEGQGKTAGVMLEEPEKTKKLLCEEAEDAKKPALEEVEKITELRLDETEQVTELETEETDQTTGLMLEEMDQTTELVLEESDQIDESAAEEKTEQTLEETGKTADSSAELAREEAKKITEPIAEQSSLDLKTADITARIKEAIERKNRLLQADEENEILRRQANEFQNLLSNLYKKTELCMALMNGDRNKCRKELQEMKKMIKQYSEQMK